MTEDPPRPGATVDDGGQSDRIDLPAGDGSGSGPLCAITDEGTPLRLQAFSDDPAPDAGERVLGSVSQPVSGHVRAAGSQIVFTPDDPGLQTFGYTVAENGSLREAKAMIFVNPKNGLLDEPVLESMDDARLAELARACQDGLALDLVRLAGPVPVVHPPKPGQRVDVASEPGQQIDLRGAALVDATMLQVDDGLLVVTKDGRMVYLAGFVEAAMSDDPVTIRIEGQEVLEGDQLLAMFRPIGLVEPAAGPTDTAPGGDVAMGDLAVLEPVVPSIAVSAGASFKSYGQPLLGADLEVTGPQAPTDLSTVEPKPVFRHSGDTHPRAPDLDPTGPSGGVVNEQPSLTVSARLDIAISDSRAERPLPFDAPPLPDLVEGQAVPRELINGVDSASLEIGASGDAIIAFRGEVALFANSIGVYLIGPGGEMQAPRLVFPAIEQAKEPGPLGSAYEASWGGDPLSPGDEVALSDVYPDMDLEPLMRFGVFLAADGGNNPRLMAADNLRFMVEDPQAGGLRQATIFDQTPGLFADDGLIDVPVFHALEPDPATPHENALNGGGQIQVISGLVSRSGGLTLAFEDIALGQGDGDFNDTLIDILPAQEGPFGPPLVATTVVIDAVIEDVDDSHLTQAVIEIVSKSEVGDRLIAGDLGGSGIEVSAESTPARLVLEGLAPHASYQKALGGITMSFDPDGGARELVFKVTDEHGNDSASKSIILDPTGIRTHFGTEDGEILAGLPGSRNAIAGGGGDDELIGAEGADALYGGRGSDLLRGHEGADTLVGGPGRDRLIGGPGADRHVFLSHADQGDLIAGFDGTTGDRLDFRALLTDDAVDSIEQLLRFDPVDLAGSDPGRPDVLISVDRNGGGDAFSRFATLVDPVGLPLRVDEAAAGGTVMV